MLTLTKLDKAIAIKAECLGVGDVIGTHNGTQHARRVDVIEVLGTDVNVFVSKPKAGGDEALLTYKVGEVVQLLGTVSDQHGEVDGLKVKRPATKRQPKAAAAPVKVTKVDAVAQTTPTPIHGTVRHATGRKMTPKAAPVADTAPVSSIRSNIRTELRSAIETLVLAEIKAVIAEVLA